VVKLRGANGRGDQPRKKGFLRDTGESILVALVLFLIIRTFAFQAFRIPTGSMEDTLLVGDFLFINKFAYGAMVPLVNHRLPGYTEPKRGDIIVFRFPQDPRQDYIKRCVAVGGDKVEMRNRRLYVNDRPVEEPFAIYRPSRSGPDMMHENFGPTVVPEGKLFMLGDNRNNSLDSRYWGFVDESLVHGKAWFIYFSWDAEKIFPRFGRMFGLIR